ncbi:MAG TPA: hypothetical protein VEI53_08840 [Ktedonobacteraceae bacterium]|nr:hypothetical protein [Ktedonobacteraceae bacterium]
MAKKSLITSSEMRSISNTSTNDTATKRMLYPPRQTQTFSKHWLWIAGLIIVGLLIFGVMSNLALQWVKTVHISMDPGFTQPSITTYAIGRHGMYEELSYTVLNAQYATSFPNDTIQTGPALVRVNLQVANKSTDQVSVIYYDVARLILPGVVKPVAPTNVHLSTGPKPGTSEVGWIDFPVSKGVTLSTLKLQLGSQLLNEASLVIPFSGAYDPNHFAPKTYPQNLTIYYDFAGNILVYHLTSVNALYAYKGTQAAVGQQFYVFNFSVDNNNGVMVSPGYGFDYIRLNIYGYNTPPVDNTLPHGFNAGAQGVKGRVVYKGPAGMKSLNFAFLVQVAQGQYSYTVYLS